MIPDRSGRSGSVGVSAPEREFYALHDSAFEMEGMWGTLPHDWIR